MLNRNEIKIIQKVAEAAKWDDYRVDRRSDKEYDLHIEGKYVGGTLFSAWLPLVAIRELTMWTSPQIAQFTNYSAMCEEGDWSGVRDSEPENIWVIFHKFVKGAK